MASRLGNGNGRGGGWAGLVGKGHRWGRVPWSSAGLLSRRKLASATPPGRDHSWKLQPGAEGGSGDRKNLIVTDVEGTATEFWGSAFSKTPGRKRVTGPAWTGRTRPRCLGRQP